MPRPTGGKEMPPTTRAALVMATEFIGLNAAARKLGVNPNTAKATVKRVRALAQKNNRDLFDPENFYSSGRTGAPEVLSDQDKENMFNYVRSSEENAKKSWVDIATACNVKASSVTLRKAFVKGGFVRVDGIAVQQSPQNKVGRQLKVVDPIEDTAEDSTADMTQIEDDSVGAENSEEG